MVALGGFTGRNLDGYTALSLDAQGFVDLYQTFRADVGSEEYVRKRLVRILCGDNRGDGWSLFVFVAFILGPFAGGCAKEGHGQD